MKFFLKSMLITSMLFLFGQQSSNAQQIPIKRSHALSEPLPRSAESLDATGTLNVIAIMVEFQPDSNRLTSGTGIFGEDGMEGLPYLSRAEDFRIEPLPHDLNYFEAHLEFAKNYYEKSSDGQLTINYQVLPDVYRLPKKMESYSPIGQTFTNEKIAELTRDAWQTVDSQNGFDTINTTGFVPEETAFIIFHAGIGRDIELTGTNLDITPFDIPSLYLRKENIGDLLNEPAFNGFKVDGGNFRVTNSMIVPRTQTRRGLDIQENEFAFPLSINGLLCASIGSHLGLPDLFNTQTGDPAIGRFGLMDGAGFFSYNGLLPPEPSAWEKAYLGWAEPFEINTEMTGEIELPASSLDQPNSIARYSLSDSEYFLIENRHRDPDNNGITITIQQPNGTQVQQTFTNQDEAFIFQQAGFDTLLSAGTFVNASNFDFSLPGGLDIGEDENDPADDRELNGGILIWHIDEAMIDLQLQNDRVNAFPERRGIDLEEADGAQDIGPGLVGALDNSAAFGTPFDFWWSGNNYRVILQSGQERSFYENRFGNDTRPDNQSNTGAPSFFELYDFAENTPVTSFKIRPAQPFAELYTSVFSVQVDSAQNFYTFEDDYYSYYPLSLSVYETPSDTFLIIPSQDNVHAVSISDPQNMRYQISDATIQQPYVGNDLVLAEKPSSSSDIGIASLAWNSVTMNFDTSWTATLPANTGFLSSLNGEVIHGDLTNEGLSAEDGTVTTLRNIQYQQSEVTGGEFSIAERDGGNNSVTFSNVDNLVYQPESAQNRLYTGNIRLNSRSVFYVFEDDRFTLFDGDSNPFQQLIFEEEAAEWPAILDDASIMRVNRSANQMVGSNKIGGTQNFTPISPPEGIQFIGTPLYTDLITSGNDYASLVVGQDSLSVNIYAYSTDGQPVPGFPLYVGKAASAVAQPIHPIIYEGTLYAVSHTGTLKAWNLSQVTDTKWGTRYGNAPFNKVSATVGQSDSGMSSEFGVLNESETYNWPNPASEMTNIRFELASPGGNVDITIIDMTGRIIHEETVSTPGGFPQEIQISTAQWGSGGYVARIKATVDGQSETKLIKIGVVH